MTCAHCICPDFIDNHIGDSAIFNGVFMQRLLQSDDQIILDSSGKLILKYIEVLQNQKSKYEVFKVWRMLLETSNNGKLLLTTASNNDNVRDLVYEVITKANTTFGKNIIAHDNNHYEPFIAELNRQRIQLLNLQNLIPGNVGVTPKKTVSYQELDYDLAWVLQRLARRFTRSVSEDESNDYVRDMMLSKHYEVKDQSREGESSSGLQAGELDLTIEDRGDLFAIIEAMRLSSLNSSYLDLHYTKLLTNYNPLLVKRTFLVTYYEGTRFEQWWTRYIEHIENLTPEMIGLSDECSVVSVDILSTPYIGLKKLIHHFNHGNEHFACIHYAVKCN